MEQVSKIKFILLGVLFILNIKCSEKEEKAILSFIAKSIINNKVEAFQVACKKYLSDAILERNLQVLIVQYAYAANEYALCNIIGKEENYDRSPPVFNLVISSNFKYLISRSGSFIKVWDLNSMNCIRNFNVSPCCGVNAVTAFACDPKAQYLTIGIDYALDSELSIWDLKHNKHVLSSLNYDSKKNSVTTLAYDPSGKYLAVATSSKEIKIFNLVYLMLIYTFNSKHSCSIFALAYSPDGRYLASGSCDKLRTVKIWDMQTKECVQTFASSNGSHIFDTFALVFNLDGSLLVVSPTDIKIYKKIYFDLLSKTPNSQVISSETTRVKKIVDSCVIS